MPLSQKFGRRRSQTRWKVLKFRRQEKMANFKRTLLAKIRDHSAIVGVVGLGYVGLPFAVEKAKVGFRVLGVEQNPLRAEKVNRGENYIRDVKDEELRELVAQGSFARRPTSAGLGRWT